MRIERVEAVLEECERHLEQTNSYNTEVEAILTSYSSSVIYSSFEKRARAIVAERGTGDGSDPHLGSFINFAATRLMRSIKIGDIAGIAGLFHQDCKVRFHAALSDEQKSAWDSIIINRTNFAHEGDDDPGSMVSILTFMELKRLYPLAIKVLEALEAALAKR